MSDQIVSACWHSLYPRADITQARLDAIEGAVRSIGFVSIPDALDMIVWIRLLQDRLRMVNGDKLVYRDALERIGLGCASPVMVATEALCNPRRKDGAE